MKTSEINISRDDPVSEGLESDGLQDFGIFIPYAFPMITDLRVVKLVLNARKRRGGGGRSGELKIGSSFSSSTTLSSIALSLYASARTQLATAQE